MTEKDIDVYNIVKQIVLNETLMKKLNRKDVIEETYDYLIDTKKVGINELPDEADALVPKVIVGIKKLFVFADYASVTKRTKFHFAENPERVEIEDHFVTVFTEKDIDRNELKDMLNYLEKHNKRIDSLGYVNYETGTTKAYTKRKK